MRKKITYTFSMVFLVSLIFSNISNADDSLSDSIRNRYIKVIEFCDKDLYFNRFLTDNYTYDNGVYQKTLHLLLDNYISSIQRLENCVNEEGNIEKKNRSSNWIKELSTQYSKDYLKKNREDIIKVLGALSFKNGNSFCENYVKDAVYYETLCHDAFNQYMKLYKTYLSESNIENAEKKSIIEKLSIENNQKMIEVVYKGMAIRDHLPVADVLINTDDRLLKYMENIAYFSSPFDLLQAIDDFYAFIDFDQN